MIKKPKILPNNQVIDLIKTYRKKKDIKARNRVVMNNVNLVYSIANRYRDQVQSNGFTNDDFFTEGIFGLINAIDKFDLERENSFTTYAYWHILKSINASVTIGTLNVPQHRINTYKKYKKIKEDKASKGEYPSIEEIAKQIGVSSRILTDTINQKDIISVNGKIHTQSSGNNPSRFEGELLDVLSKNFDPEEELIKKLDFEKTEDIMVKHLKKRDRQVLRYRYGLDGDKPQTLEDIAVKLKISKEYVRIIQRDSLKKLKKIMTRKSWSR